MSYIVKPGDIVVVAGDSKTVGGIPSANGPSAAWPHGNLEWDLNTVLQAKGNAPIAGFHITGMGGAVSQDLIDNLNAWVLAFNPTLVFLACWVNDSRGSLPPLTTAAHLATVATTIWASFPTCRIVVCGADFDGNKWPTGQNPNDALLDATNAQLVIEVATLSASGAISYADLRNGYWFPAIQAANPTNNPASIALSTDSLHPNQTAALGESAYVASLATAAAGLGIATVPPLKGVGTVGSPIGLTPVDSINPGSMSASNFTKLSAIVRPKQGANLTDANQTLNPFTDKASQYVQLASVPLTANRTKLLDPTGGFAGLCVRVVRADAANFTMTVSNNGPGGSAAGTYTFGAAMPTPQAAVFQHNGTDYNLIAVENLTS